MGESRKAEIKSLLAQEQALRKRREQLEREEVNEFWSNVEKRSFIHSPKKGA